MKNCMMLNLSCNNMLTFCLHKLLLLLSKPSYPTLNLLL